ncbi:hypothetical protein FHS13_001767 [Nocardiopsis algeriensis]|uniref:DNA-binding domain-containing protein n=1 Tax=Nocardiopsis algeriensis TaxID=1478215 RepID=A0A841IRB1_9ACTN|nr:hypothetical protein [Nocardiopsis algeriensis]
MSHTTHANACLAPTGRLALARCVVEDGWPLRRAAERFQVAVTTAKRWADRYRTPGQAGMSDCSSRPRPGELVHVDIKKLGNIPDGGGHRVVGRHAGIRNKQAKQQLGQLLDHDGEGTWR